MNIITCLGIELEKKPYYKLVYPDNLHYDIEIFYTGMFDYLIKMVDIDNM